MFAHKWPGKIDMNREQHRLTAAQVQCTCFASIVQWQIGAFMPMMGGKSAGAKSDVYDFLVCYCSALINFLRHHGHQLQVLYLDGEELTDNSIHAISDCPVLRCLRVSFSGLLMDRCLLSLKVF